MAVNMIARRKASYQDPRLVPLRKEGIALLKKHGAVSHRFGCYHSGVHAGQILVVVGYPRQGNPRASHAKHVAGCRLAEGRW
jgi:hypothetical protein